ncbi:MAG: hypothetical protein ABH878_10705 [bacterium]
MGRLIQIILLALLGFLLFRWLKGSRPDPRPHSPETQAEPKKPFAETDIQDVHYVELPPEDSDQK